MQYTPIKPFQKTDAPRKTSGRRKLPKELDLKRIVEAVRADRQELEPYRRNRREAVRQTAGKYYGDNAAMKDVPVNLLNMYVQVMSRSLIANSPRVMYSTFDTKQESAVETMEGWGNEEIKRMHAVDRYAETTTDALYCLGIMMVALAQPADAAMSGWDLKAGQPFMTSIDLDDFVCDMRARKFDALEYAGHRFDVPVRVANALWKKGSKDDEFEAEEDSDLNYGGDDKIGTIGRQSGHRETIEDHCTIWQLYFPQHKLIVLLRDNGGIPDETRDPILVQDWIGPPCGPYHYFSLGEVSGQLMPNGPINQLYSLALNYNAAYRKLLRQLRDYKKVLPYRGGNSEDVKRLKEENDGGTFQCDNPELLKEIEFGGPSNSVLTMSDHVKSSFDFIGGGLALLGGRSPQSRTASQDKMLNENASAGVADMQDKAVTFVQSTMEAMNWYWWYHPTKVMRTTWSPPSFREMKLTREVHPWSAPEDKVRRTGPMPAIKIDVHSLAKQTPQSRLAFINQVLQTVAPMMQVAAQQGVFPDMNELISLFAKHGDEPDLQKIFHYATPTEPQQGGDGGGMPANTSRTYERISSGGQGPQEKAADLSARASQMEGPVNPNSGGQ